MAPANTGKESNNRTVVTRIDQTKRGIRSNSIPKVRRFPKVLKKFTAPRIDLIPAKCREKIAKSTDLPA